MMTFAESSSAARGTIADLREIVGRLQSDSHESVHLLGQIEQLLSEIEQKAVGQKQQAFVAPAATTIMV